MTMPLRLATAAVIGVLVLGGALLPQPVPATLRRSTRAIGERQSSGEPRLSLVAERGARASTGMSVASASAWRTGASSSAAVAPRDLSTAESYDPSTGAWTATGSMLDPAPILSPSGSRMARSSWAEAMPAPPTWMAPSCSIRQPESGHAPDR